MRRVALIVGNGTYLAKGGPPNLRFPQADVNALETVLLNLFFGGRQRPGPLFDFVTARCWRTDQGVMAHRFRMAEQVDFNGRLGEARVPALLMAGERDLLVSEAGLRTLATELPRARAVQLPGCGHLAFVTRPERVAEEVRGFLAEVAQA